MTHYYVALISKSHAFLLERRLKGEGIMCELTYMPRAIMIDLCNMGVRFEEGELQNAISSIRRSGLPGCKIYKEILYQNNYQYVEIRI